jgi:hypothetical protein
MIPSLTQASAALSYLPELIAGLGTLLVLLVVVGVIVRSVRRLRRIEDKVDALGAERSQPIEPPSTAQPGKQG